MQPFAIGVIGGVWGRRMARRRAWVDALPWDEVLPDDTTRARGMWTQTAFSEYASAAAFAEIAARLLACGAPIDLVAAAGDFVVDELVHTEAAARLAHALGGAVVLDVDLERLVRPPSATDALLRACELVVRVSCVGEALTVPILKLARDLAGSPLIAGALAKIVADESGHAQFGWWVLDWAAPRLDDHDRAHLARVAGAALRAYAPTLAGSPDAGACASSGLGVLGCDRFDSTFVAGAQRFVAKPLAERGIVISADDLGSLCCRGE